VEQQQRLSESSKKKRLPKGKGKGKDSLELISFSSSALEVPLSEISCTCAFNEALYFIYTGEVGRCSLGSPLVLISLKLLT